MTVKTETEIAEELAEKELGKTTKTEIDQIAEKIISIRQRPLLVLYWHDCDECSIENNHYLLVYRELRKYMKSICELDVLLHTTGGSIDGSFSIAKGIREVANKVNYMIPYMAWSGGTSIAISGDSILMGSCAQLSAINPKSDGRLATYLIAIIAYIRNVMSRYIESFEDEDKAVKVTAIDQVLIEHLIKGNTAQEIAEMWALRRKSRYYDKQMLTYTKPHPNQEEEIEELLNILACDDLDHGTIFDFDVLKGLLLPVDKMELELSDLTQELVDKLREKGDNFEICDRVGEDKRAPFIKYHPAPIEKVDDR